MRIHCADLMAKPPVKKSKKIPLNLNLAPTLRAYVDKFVEMNDRKSAVAVVEEAIREFFKNRGIDTDVPPAQLLKALTDTSEGNSKHS